MATFRKRGNKWQVQIRRSGLSPISRSFLILKDAQKWARQVEREADQGELPVDWKVLRSVTLGELIHRYRETVSIRKRTGKTERIVLSAFLRHPICLKRLSELRTADFAAYRDARLQEIKPSSLRREIAPIRHLFEVARHEWGLPIRDNPLKNLTLTDADPRRERRLQSGELDRLLQASRSSKNKFLRPVILFALLTAMRRGEILALKWSEIDWAAATILIPVSKTGKARTIPLLREAAEILVSLERRGDRVFPITANALRLAWDRLLRRAGVADLHFHDLRHEAISRLFEVGLSTSEVALISFGGVRNEP